MTPACDHIVISGFLWITINDVVGIMHVDPFVCFYVTALHLSRRDYVRLLCDIFMVIKEGSLP